MKKFRLLFASMFMMAGTMSTSISAASIMMPAIGNAVIATDEAYTVNDDTDVTDDVSEENTPQDIPGKIDLTKGVFDGGKLKEVTIDGEKKQSLDSFRNGKSVSYDINVTEAGKYKAEFASACNQSDVKLLFTISDKKTGSVEAEAEVDIDKNGDWGDFSTKYSVGISELTVGTKILKITFESIDNKYTTNVVDIEFVKDNTSGINNVNVSTAKDSSTCYTVSGIRAATPVKGNIYIKNGKKVFIK